MGFIEDQRRRVRVNAIVDRQLELQAQDEQEKKRLALEGIDIQRTQALQALKSCSIMSHLAVISSLGISEVAEVFGGRTYVSDQCRCFYNGEERDFGFKYRIYKKSPAVTVDVLKTTNTGDYCVEDGFFSITCFPSGQMRYEGGFLGTTVLDSTDSPELHEKALGKAFNHPNRYLNNVKWYPQKHYTGGDSIAE